MSLQSDADMANELEEVLALEREHGVDIGRASWLFRKGHRAGDAKPIRDELFRYMTEAALIRARMRGADVTLLASRT